MFEAFVAFAALGWLAGLAMFVRSVLAAHPLIQGKPLIHGEPDYGFHSDYAEMDDERPSG